MNWLALSVRTRGEDRAGVVGALIAAGARAVEEIGDDLRTYLPVATDLDPVTQAVSAASPSARIETSEVRVADWDRAWRGRLTIQRAGRLVVAPPWLADGLDPTSTIIIDPGMAFGTGDHATTRGVLRLAAAVVRAGDHVADLGAGSAILSIAAARLGATRVAAIELDPDAIGNAEANVRANGVGDRVSVLFGEASLLLPLLAPVRVVLANIVAPALLSLLPVIGCALGAGGRAIVGGITEDERPDFLAVTREAGWCLEGEDREEQWWSAVIARP